MNERKRTKVRAIKIGSKTGSGNVFADLGLPNSEEMLSKAKLASEICDIISHERLTQKQAAARLQIDQPKISALMHGKLDGFSTDRLMRFLNALGKDVLVTISPAQEPKHASVRICRVGA